MVKVTPDSMLILSQKKEEHLLWLSICSLVNWLCTDYKVFSRHSRITLLACAESCTKLVSIHQNWLQTPALVQSCGHFWGSSLRLCRRTEGKHSSCSLQSVGVPDGLLIDFLVLSQFFITASLSWVCDAGLVFWTLVSTFCLCSWGSGLWREVIKGTVFDRRNR